MRDVRSVEELPESELLAVSVQFGVLVDAVGVIGNRFVHSEPVIGAPRSMRLLLQRATDKSAPLPGTRNSRGIVEELIKLQPEARYDPPTAPEGKVKGWEIRRIIIENMPAVLALAAWVPTGSR